MKYLITGLGNIGAEYEGTRHNIGFSVLDRLAAMSGLTFRHDRHAYVTEYKFKGRTFILVKPTTFMNLSGKAVQYWMQAEKIPVENLLVITDDLALPFGTIRIKAKGGAGGHNGLTHIEQTLHTQEYARLRFGVGNDFPKGRQVEYVLGKWSEEQKKALDERLDKCCEAIRSFGTIGIGMTMTNFNADKKPAAEKRTFREQKQLVDFLMQKRGTDFKQESGNLSFLLLLKTANQQSWVIASTEHLFFVIDDLRKPEPELRTSMSRSALIDNGTIKASLHVNSVEGNFGRIDIDPNHKGWMFSRDLFKEDNVDDCLRDLIQHKMK